MKITIRVFDDGKEIVAKSFGEGVFRAGRSEFSDIVLPNDKVSRSHVEFRINEAAIYFTNMSSPGAVKLNGKAKETGEIADGDEVQIGPYKMLIAYGESVDAAPLGDSPAVNGDEAAAALGGNAPNDGGGFGGGGGGFGDAPLGNLGEVAAMNAEADGDVAVKELSSPGSGLSLGKADTDVELKPLVAKLVFTEGPKKGDELVLEAYEVTFGRSKSADIFLDDERLSRVHAKIARVGMGYRLVDMESRNGTFVNGMRVLEHPLASFDEIQIGSSKIKFLIHDVMIGGGMDKNVPTSLVSLEGAPIDQTESIAVAALSAEQLQQIRPNVPGGGRVFELPVRQNLAAKFPMLANMSRRNQIILGAVAGLLLVFLLLPSGPAPDSKNTATADPANVDKLANVKIPPAMPKEYGELNEDQQRSVEGHYNSALKAADAQDYEAAVAHLKNIHEFLPYYKKSRELMDRYGKKVKEKQIADAQEKAKNDEKQDLAMYLQDGIEYLKEGDFEKAGEAFNSAIVIDPTNPVASKGLRAADAKVRDISQLPPEVDPEMEKKKAVLELFQRAVAALQVKQYQEAINTAEQVRKIELKGDTQYLNEAKQIIDQAKILQKEEFEPFLITAKEKFAEGDFNESRNLCEEMLKKDPSYLEAQECVLRARKNLHRLAKEAYTHAYVLESMNRIEEAKQYWNRAKNYVRPGDEYYDKVYKKLDYYQ